MPKLVLPGDNRATTIGEVGKIRWEVLRFLQGEGLDLGPGFFKVSNNAVGIDSEGSPGIQANLIQSAESLKKFAAGEWGFVFSSFLLHLLPNWGEALKEWWRVIKTGGYLILYLPHPDLAGYGISVKEFDKAAQKLKGGWDLLLNETRDQDDEYGLLRVYRKRADGVCSVKEPVQAEKTCAVIRYGGIGDHIMTASILPQLKREGWRVVYVTNPAGKEVVLHDPHIDEIWTDTASLSFQDLTVYWKWLETKFDRTINMMNSLENFLIPQPGQGNYSLSETARRMLFGAVGYLDAHHIHAEVAMGEKPEAFWYPSEAEKKWARKEREKVCKGVQNPILITWSLSGSAVHKKSPFTPQALLTVLENCPQAVIVTVGGPSEAELYEKDGYPDHPRHIRTAGKVWTVRQMLSFCLVSDVVVGPETAVLNAVGLISEISKVVWLSHSNAANLCERWEGHVLAITPDPEVAPCHPCHRLHWGWDNCHQHPESGASLCVHGISPVHMAGAVLEAIEARKEARAA